MPKPSADTYFPYFKRYVDLVPEEDLMEAFTNQLPIIKAFLASISEEKSMYAYAEGKWTLREMLLHMTDTERIFCYRALAVARGEKQPLPGFDENVYATNSNANSRTWQNLGEEFLAVRQTTEMLFSNFSAKALQAAGTASNNPITVLSLGFTTLGHFYHHQNIAIERYL